MFKWFKKYNIQYWILSFFIALALWIYVTVMLDPEISNTVTGIPVIYTDADILNSAELIKLSGPDMMSVTFEGRRTDLNALNNKTITAVVSLADIKQSGESKLFYDLEGPSEMNSVRIAEAQSYVTVTADNLVRKEIPVRYNLDVIADVNYTLETEQISPMVITLRGPESIIQDISEARVQYTREDPLRQSYEKTLEYTLCDENGAAVAKNETITADTDRITLTQRVLMLKELPLRLRTEDGGGLVREMLEFDFNPKTITVKGEEGSLEELTALTVGSINLSTLEEDKTFNFQDLSLLLPEGVSSVSGVEEAEVTVRIIGAVKRQINVPYDNFNLSNNVVPNGYMAKFITTMLYVTIRGPEASVAAVEPHNISVVVDMPEGVLGSQTYTRKARVTVNGYPDVGVIDLDYTVSVSVVTIPVQGVLGEDTA